jgi:hypothetical protein
MKAKLTKQEFVLKAIERLRTEKSKGIHVVWSGFNQAFEKYFGETSRATTDEMKAQGLIDVIPFSNGIIIYKKGEAPDRTQEVINKIVG